MRAKLREMSNDLQCLVEDNEILRAEIEEYFENKIKEIKPKKRVTTKTFREEKFVRKLIRLFGDNCSCGIQALGCPCNTCFHSQNADFNHICWLIVLGLRGDYDVLKDDILEHIKEELESGKNERN